MNLGMGGAESLSQAKEAAFVPVDHDQARRSGVGNGVGERRPE
jgi:hypothetical protein